MIGYVFDRLDAGWTPDAGPLPPLTILDPKPGQPVPGLPQRGLLSRVFGR